MKKHCIANCGHNTLHALSTTLDALWRYDQYVKDACDKDCRQVWQKIAELDRQKKELLLEALESKAKSGDLR